ncbi:hypothetical protein [Seonamhaeicola sp.]|uniref:hypothetical protein n=1 Tax=Seonamhaeicola sp. TaxID=1912245 RepID=UPI00261C9D6E|nr:hypothetical protein [Seonamhaeicola sp.]
MSKTIKNILILAVITLIGSTAVAQQNELTEAQSTQMETQIKAQSEKLDLSEDQKKTYEDITKKYGLEMINLKESGKGRLSKYKAYKSIIENKNKEMKALLSEEQYATYEEIQEEMQKRMKKRNKNNS